ncbi:hypothetical protein ACJJTC_002923 [Scirpophaga incertulas]
MQNADLPTKIAQEPIEEARQPMVHKIDKMAEERNINNSHQCGDVSSSQNTCSQQPSQALSLPARGLDPMARRLWLQQRRTTGLWVQCDKCDKWRYIPNIIDRYELSKIWYCNMNPDQTVADCSVPEVAIKVHDDEELIYSEYSAGSLVWARLGDWPWWPAMVDDCPDTEQFYWLDGFSDIPTHYNVAFFDSAEVTRAWIRPNQLKSYSANKTLLKKALKKKEFRKRLNFAMKQADDAAQLPLSDRLSKYSFIARYNGKLGKPKKISKAVLKKIQKAMEKKLNANFSEESDFDSNISSVGGDEQLSPIKEAKKRENVVFGTPKTTATKTANNTSDDKIDVNALSNEWHVTDMEMEPNKSSKLQYDADQQNSLTGSILAPSALDTLAIDNDSSKTYVPDTEIAPVTEDITQSMQTRVDSPCSDDFDF